jgi:hypothetical protein
VINADVMVRAVDGALELAEEVLGLVRAHVATCVLALAVINGVMGDER